jgi:peptidoglycan/xylan/chitin deacetylase (PgdA/CDA1 family)
MLVAAGGTMLTAAIGVLTSSPGGPGGSSGAKLTVAGSRTRRKPTPTAAASRTTATPSRTPPASRHTSPARVAAHHQQTAEPVYYIHDGPKTIALTIDDGPSPIYTPQILRLLDKYKITASFSMIGRSVAEYPAIAREVARAGHVITNHTWAHLDLAALPPVRVQDEIARATAAIHTATGDTPRLFRAPYGAWSATVLDYCARNHLTALDWSVDPADWAMPGTGAIVRNLLRNTRTGSIILEHDGGGNRSETVAALKIVIPQLLDKGYRFRTP